MHILRRIFTLKVIVFVTLSTLFMTTMPLRQAQARHSCPCDYLEALVQAKRNYAKADAPFPELRCIDNLPDVGLIIEDTDEAFFQIGAFRIPECGSDFCCDSFFDIPNDFIPFPRGTVSQSFDVITTSAEQDASCRRKLRAIARWWLHIPCLPPE